VTFRDAVNFPRARLGAEERLAQVGERMQARQHAAERDGGDDGDPNDGSQARKRT
jgi:hypothetical protein